MTPPVVLSFEDAALVRIARAATGALPPRAALPDLRAAHPELEGLDPDTVDVLTETLARGLVAALVRRGGWRARGGARLWERHGPDVFEGGLGVGAPSFELLRALAREPCGETLELDIAATGPVSLGDELTLYLVADLLVRCDLDAVVSANAEVFAASTLARLALPAELGRPVAPDEAREWLAAPRVVLLEGVEQDLVRHIRRTETLRRSARGERRGELARAIEQCSGVLIRAAVSGSSPRAAGFWLDAMAPHFLEGAEVVGAWLGGRGPRLSPLERALAASRAMVVPELTLAFEEAAARARAIRHFDDDFAVAQATLSWLEPWEESGFRAARRLLDELRTVAAEEAAPEQEVAS